MSFRAIQRILGLLLMVFSLTMLPPVGVSLYYGDGTHAAFLAAFAWLVAVGAAVWWPARRDRRDLRLRDGFVVVTLFWTVLGTAGALPLYISPQPAIGLTDAVFEAVSGLTTTGATILVGLDALPRSILYYRQQLQWLGGMGIVILAVALLPMLGVGGMSLYRAEMPGPVKDTKLAPRITQSARMLWVVYVTITAACAAGYALAGMAPFDAIGHAFATVAIGGFSHYDASLGQFDSRTVELVAVFFMLIGSDELRPALRRLAQRAARRLLARPGMRGVPAPDARAQHGHPRVPARRRGLRRHPAARRGRRVPGRVHRNDHAASRPRTTTTGRPGSRCCCCFASFVGGCAGSTAGGLKVVRCLLLVKQGRREIIRLVHPTRGDPGAARRSRGAAARGGRRVGLLRRLRGRVHRADAGADGHRARPGDGLLGHRGDAQQSRSRARRGREQLRVAGRSPASGSAFSAMLLGRLEIFTLLILFTVTFWRK